MAASPAPQATCSSPEPTAVRNASTACRRKSSASARTTTTCSNAYRRARSMSPAGCRGFLQRWSGTPFNERQVKLLNRLLDGFEGKLSSSKWAAIAQCSPDTALRDITQLLELGVLKKSPGGGRSTGYELAGQ